LIQKPSYYRARLAAIADEIKRETDEKRIKLLQNGYFPNYQPSPQSQKPALTKEVSHDNSPLSFLELCSWDTWFTMHPEKVCGEVVITTSRSFPLAVKASSEDVVRTVTEGIETAKRIRIAKAKLILLNLNIMDKEDAINGHLNKKKCVRIMKEYDKKDIYTTHNQSVSDFKGFLEQCKRAINKLYGYKVSTKCDFWSTWDTEKASIHYFKGNYAEQEKARKMTYWEFLKQYGYLSIQDGVHCIDFDFDGVVFAAYSSQCLIEMGVYTKEEIDRYVECSLLISE